MIKEGNLNLVAGRWITRLAAATVALSGLAAIIRPLVRYRLPVLFERRFLPPALERSSHLAAIAIGIILIYVAYGLLERRVNAWRIATIALFAAGILAAISGQRAPTVEYLLLGLALVSVHRYFMIRSGGINWKTGTLAAGTGILLALSYGVVGFYFMDRRDFNQDFTLVGAITQTFEAYFGIANALVPKTRHADFFLDSMNVIGLGAILGAIISLLRPLRYRLYQEPHTRAVLQDLMARYSSNPEDYFKLWPPDKSIYLTEDRLGGVAYGVANGVAIALGDPVARPGKEAEVIQGFCAMCWDHGWQPVFAYGTDHLAPSYETLGLSQLKIGEDALINLEQFVVETARNKHFRNINNRFTKSGFEFKRHLPPHADSVIWQTAAISRAWVSQPGRREWSFAAGAYTPSYLQQGPLAAVYDAEGRMVAFANELPIYASGIVTIDLMRFDPDAPSNVMDYLFLRLFEALHQAGHQAFSLGLAPLAGLNEAPSQPVERILGMIYASRQPFLSFQGLRQFKDKFKPDWQSRYLYYPAPVSRLAPIAVGLTRLMGRPNRVANFRRDRSKA